jgi:hypothetical protein
METTRSANSKTSRTRAVVAFWEQRAGRKLTTREASEMQANVEGVIALLAEWDRSDGAAVGRVNQHDTSKD